MTSRYNLNIHQSVITKDLPTLPYDLQIKFEKIFKPILRLDPHKCKGLPWHYLTGKLRGYRALEVEWEGDPNAYRLVYKIWEKPAPKHVEIIGFGRHSIYPEAQRRRGKK